MSAVYFEKGELKLSGNAQKKAEQLYTKYADTEKWEKIMEQDFEDIPWGAKEIDDYLTLRLLAYGPLDQSENGYLNADIYGIDTGVLSELEPIRGKIDKEKFESGKYALVFTKYIKIEDEKNMDDDLYEPGNILTLSSNDMVREYEVMAVCDIPFALSTQSYQEIYGHVLIPDSEYFSPTENRNAMSIMIKADDEHFEDVNTQLQNLVGQNSSLVIKKQA